MDARAKELVDIGNNERSQRQPLVSLWQDIAENMHPFRADFTREHSFGDDFMGHLSEAYPVLARQELGNSLSTMLRNRGVDWFTCSTGDEDEDSKPHIAQGLEYLTKVTKAAMYDPKARFTRATKEGDHDYAAFGQCVISVEEAPSRDALLYRSWHLRDCVWMDDATGRTNRMDREFKLSARNYMAHPVWSKKAPETVKKAARQEPGKTFRIRHIVMPGDEYDFTLKEGDGKGRKPPFVSIYVDVENCVVLSEGPLPRFSYVVPRWQTVSNWQYAFSPAAIIALPDARMLQTMARTIQEAAEYAVDPAWIATEDAIRSDVNVFPGGISWTDSAYDERLGEALRPLQRGGDVRLGVDMKQDSREMIAQAFLLNKLQLPPAGEDMTATEVLKRIEEYIRAALPLFEPVETEYNNPLVEITYEMLAERGGYDFERLPRELRDTEFEFKFHSPLQEAEARRRVTQFQETVALIQAGGPEGLARIDMDKALTDAIRGTGAPADWLVSDDDAKAAREEMEAQAEGQAALNQIEQGGAAASNVADATAKLAAQGLIQ